MSLIETSGEYVYSHVSLLVRSRTFITFRHVYKGRLINSFTLSYHYANTLLNITCVNKSICIKDVQQNIMGYILSYSSTLRCDRAAHDSTDRVMCCLGFQICICISNILKPTKSLYDFRFKIYGSNSGFNNCCDLGLYTFIQLRHTILLIGLKQWI